MAQNSRAAIAAGSIVVVARCGDEKVVPGYSVFGCSRWGSVLRAFPSASKDSKFRIFAPARAVTGFSDSSKRRQRCVGLGSALWSIIQRIATGRVCSVERGVPMAAGNEIRIVGARQHNLKNVSVRIPHDAMTVVTGLSGSGKSSLAFNTLYAEGERKFVESLSAYARQFLEQMPKPDVDRIAGLRPTIAIEQHSGSSNPRSTVATTTEIYDYLRVLFAQIGTPHCFVCRKPIVRSSIAQMVDAVVDQPEGTRVVLAAPVWTDGGDDRLDRLDLAVRNGFVRVRVNGTVYAVEEAAEMSISPKDRIDIVVDRLVVRNQIGARLADSLEIALKLGGGRAIAAMGPDVNSLEDHAFSEDFCCAEHPDATLPELSPRMFSFNSPLGACPDCNGLGARLEFDADLVIADRDLSLKAGAVTSWPTSAKRTANGKNGAGAEQFCKHFGIEQDVPFRNISEDVQRIILHGTRPADVKTFGHQFEGVIPSLKSRWAATDSESVKQRLMRFMSEAPCLACGGARLRRELLAVTMDGRSIAEICALDIAEARSFFNHVKFKGEASIIAKQPVHEIRNRLRFLEDVGLSYLTLDRASATLSGGEAQRIRLATQIGSGLVGVCYVLDEPTIGLHQRDGLRLVGTLKKLAQEGNTVVVVEHDEDMIAAADQVIDMGPGAGAHGGEVIAEGTLDDILRSPKSITGQYLTGKLEIPVPEKRRRTVATNRVEIRGAKENNLKNITVSFPLGCFVCVTGVSGSGKSTLVTQILQRVLHRRIYGTGRRPGAYDQIVGASRIDKIIEIDQSPIGRSPRSNPATYVGAFDLVRKLYAKTRDAKIRGYGPGRFSFNIKGGRCEDCQGQGTKRIEMHFLPDVFVECGSCRGSRYNRETLEVRYRGKTIANVLELRIDEASIFFQNFKKTKQLLRALIDVGLGYMKLGQSATTLSGGEAQRVKLAAELGKSASDHTLYILDEPTTGLHFADIQKLLRVLDRLVSMGHTVLVVEHNLDVIKMSDWIIDLGPEGGDEGGEIVAQGTPEDIVKVRKSHTGRHLKPRLEGKPPLTPTPKVVARKRRARVKT